MKTCVRNSLINSKRKICDQEEEEAMVEKRQKDIIKELEEQEYSFGLQDECYTSSDDERKAAFLSPSRVREKTLDVDMKTLRQTLIREPFKLALKEYKISSLNALDPLLDQMSDLSSIDLSYNQIKYIDWLNQLKQLRKIRAVSNMIRQVDLNLLNKLQELDLRNNFIEKLPALKQLPALRILVLKDNKITKFRLNLCSFNYLYLQVLDVRNNRIKMSVEQVLKVADKLKKFKALRTFNLNDNAGIDMNGATKESKDAFLKMIDSFPTSLVMFNNMRRNYFYETAAELKCVRYQKKWEEDDEAKDSSGRRDKKPEESLAKISMMQDVMKNQPGLEWDSMAELVRNQSLDRLEQTEKHKQEDLEKYRNKVIHKYRKEAFGDGDRFEADATSEWDWSEEDKDERKEENEHDEKYEEPQSQRILLPSLKTFLFNLEQASSQPTNALRYLKKIYSDTDLILRLQKTTKSKQEFDEIFMLGFEETIEKEFSQRIDGKQTMVKQVKKNFETEDSIVAQKEGIQQFMHYMQMLANTNEALREIAVTIISCLVMIPTQDFGIQCFTTIHEMFIAEEEHVPMFRKMIINNVIVPLTRMPENQISLPLLHKLRDFFEDRDETAILYPLLSDWIPTWLSAFNDLEVYKTKRESTEHKEQQRKEQLVTAMIELITAGLTNSQINTELFVHLRQHITVAQIFLLSHERQDRYVPLLNCISEMAKTSEQAANDFICLGIHSRLTENLRASFYEIRQFQKFQSKAESVRDQLAEIKPKYDLLAQQTEVMGALLNASNMYKMSIINLSSMQDLFAVMIWSDPEPVILGQVCYLAIQLINSLTMFGKQTKFGDDSQEEFIDKAIHRMGDCTRLISFLGFTDGEEMVKFENLLAQISFLHTAHQEGDLEISFAECHDLETKRNQLDEPILINLFIQIVQLIEFFHREYAILEFHRQKLPGKRLIDRNQRKLHEIYHRVCDKMDNARREDALFNCLNISNDLLRVAVCKALFYVPVAQLDKEEMQQLLDLIENNPNVGLGENEIVLSIIFQLLTNIVRNTQKEALERVKDFKQNFINDAIRLALLALRTNLERKCLEKDEEMQKMCLSLSIINFLKYITLDSTIKDQLFKVRVQDEIVKRCLELEQNKTVDPSFEKVPIDIEVSALGQDVGRLKSLFQSSRDSLKPYNYVSFRVIHQIASNLEYEKHDELYAPHDVEMVVNIEEFIETAKIRFNQRTTFEHQLWSDFNPQRIFQIKEQMDKIAIVRHEQYHRMFSMTNAVKEILIFLTQHDDELENWLASNCDQEIKHVGSIKKHSIFGRGLLQEMERRVAKEKGDMTQILLGVNALGDRFQEESKQVTSLRSPANRNKRARQLGLQNVNMLNSFKYSYIGAGYQPSGSQIFVQLRKQSIIEKRMSLRQEHFVGVHNTELRSLTISAFLRCLYASIESAPSANHYEEALENVRCDQAFLTITKLCSTTGWIYSNIGTKYLQVMRYIIRIAETARLDDKNNLIKYEILSIVVQRILGILEEKIYNHNGNLEIKVDEKVLLSHVAIICNQMIHQATLFDWLEAGQGDQNQQHNTSFSGLGTTIIDYSKESEWEREKRSKLNSHLLGKLFPMSFVRILIEAVFSEMKLGQDRLHGIISEDGSSKTKRLQFSAGDRLVEHTKKFLSMYIAHCSENRYDVNHYIMTGVCQRQQNQVRTSFIEEILSGANQILVAEQLLRVMDRGHSLSYQNYEDTQDWIRQAVTPEQQLNSGLDDNMKAQKQKIPMALKVRDQLRRDHYLGERIHMTMPMMIHIASSTDTKRRGMALDQYVCLNTILTNHGVYLINDENVCFHMDPARLKHLPCPSRVFSFNYKSIKSLYYGHRLEQRITIKVDVNVNNSPWWSTAHNQTNLSSKRGRTKSPRKQRNNKDNIEENEYFYVTLIAPSIIEMLQMRSIFEMAVEQNKAAEQEDEENLGRIQQDGLVHMVIIECIIKNLDALAHRKSGIGSNKINEKLCPFCKKSRQKNDCECEHHVAYCFMITDHAKQLSRINKTKQRGGTVRLLSTDPKKQEQENEKHAEQKPAPSKPTQQATFRDLNQLLHLNLNTAAAENAQEPRNQPQFGILVISPTDFWFMKEQPGYWDEELANLNYDALQYKVKALINDKTNVGGLINQSFTKITMDSIDSLRIITSRVPAIELTYTDIGGRQESIAFSMLSDHFTQETLISIKRLKKMIKRSKRKVPQTQRAASYQKTF